VARSGGRQPFAQCFADPQADRTSKRHMSPPTRTRAGAKPLGTPAKGGTGSPSKARIDRLALQREHAKHALVYAVQRVAPCEAFKGFNTQRELA